MSISETESINSVVLSDIDMTSPEVGTLSPDAYREWGAQDLAAVSRMRCWSFSPSPPAFSECVGKNTRKGSKMEPISPKTLIKAKKAAPAQNSAAKLASDTATSFTIEPQQHPEDNIVQVIKASNTINNITKMPKNAPSKSKRKIIEPATGGWDILPHGMGKAGEAIDKLVSTANSTTNDIGRSKTRPAKRTREKNENKITADVEVKVLDHRSTNVMTAEIKQLNVSGRDNSITSNLTHELRRGRSRYAINNVPCPVVQETTDLLRDDPIYDPLQQKPKRKNMKAQAIDYEYEDLEEEKPRKRRAHENIKTTNALEDIMVKLEDPIDTSRNAKGNMPRRKKANPYGLTPGYSPFPDWPMPTPEACEEVSRLLSELHGVVKPPEVIPPPSMDVTGCGEVPDLLDAILRTLLSASTTANNSNLALKGLSDKFGLRTEGIGKGSVNWEVVHKADLTTVIDAIKQGGLAKVKGTNIKKILDTVYAQNLARRDALQEEKSRIGTSNTRTEHHTEIAGDLGNGGPDNGLLSMNHIFEMTTDEAMEELTKLPGIGVKTASCVILFCMKRPSFAVDTHVWRHCKWLGWVPETATRDQTFSHCEVRIPNHLKYPLHQLFLRHGKTCGRCRANTSAGTVEWMKTICPIEHLVNRKEERKMLVSKLTTKSRSVTNRKKKTLIVKKRKVRKVDNIDYSDEDEEISSSEEDEDSDYEDEGY
ncbi:hypothetical protein B7463_g6979, partial [Scytalidium lignicola]